jgi:hypothetical protein
LEALGTKIIAAECPLLSLQIPNFAARSANPRSFRGE